MSIRPELRRELLTLPAEERQELADELYESLDKTVDPEWEAEWSKEIAARIADAAKNPGDVVDARQALRELSAEFSAKPR